MTRQRRTAWGLAAALVAAVPLGAGACDVCAIYTGVEMGERRPGLHVGVAEQYTFFDTRQQDGHEVPNPGERLKSSITQVLFGYNFAPRFGVQLTVPIITRTFHRLEEGRLVRGDATGFGDLSLLLRGLVVSTVTEETVFHFSLLGGLKLPSGNPDRLREEQAEEHDHGDEEESAIHGHDLTLGSGSVDGIVGGQLFWSWRRLFVTAVGQYAIRTPGEIDYRFANDLTWAAGPGVYALLGHDHTLGVQALQTGETKGNDTLDGEKEDDTAITALYLGPALTFTWGTSLAADLAADLPVLQHNTGLQIVPAYRLRGGLTWRF